jgi:hypothetical protein
MNSIKEIVHIFIARLHKKNPRIRVYSIAKLKENKLDTMNIIQE